jgi:peptidyl-prolyl cis-trans isomerase D
MIGFIRKYLTSWLVLALFGLILLAFMLGDFSSGKGGLGAVSGSGSRIAKIGSQEVTSQDVINRVQAEFEAARQQRPGLTMAEFDAQGGIDSTIDRLINSRTIIAFAQKHGMVISERLIDSDIAKTSAFYGVTGKFDRTVYLRVIGDRRLSEDDHRLDVRASMLADQLVAASSGASRAPKELLLPYASLMLEKRFGAASFVSTAAFLGAAPTDAEVKIFYDRNLARYTVPETRVARYALFDRAQFEGKVSATDGDIEAAYKKDAAKYAASEKRVLTQVIVPTEAAAKVLTASVRSGTAIAAAAAAAGLEATTLDPQDKKSFASLSSAAAADAAFSAATSSVTDPQKSGLGWHVIRVDSATSIAGRSLAQVRAEIAPALTKRKVEEALADMIVRIEDSIADGATFEDVVKAEGLTVATTPAVTESGISPSDRAFRPSAELPAIMKDAFQSEQDDDASVVVITPGERDAVVKLDRIIPAAPKPLAGIRDQVAADAQADRASRAARKAANDLVAKVNAGAKFADAVKAAGLSELVPISGQRLEMAQAGDKAPAPLTTLFELSRGKARAIEAPGGKGYAIIALEKLEAGDAKARPDIVAATEGELSRIIGDEYTQQLLTAMKADLEIQRDQSAINQVKKSLLSGTATR